jgi:hypothetical protein
MAGAVALPMALAAVGPELWDCVACCTCQFDDGLDDLANCGQKRVSRLAERTRLTLREAGDRASECDGKGCFRALTKLAKRARKTSRAAERKGFGAEGIPCGLESLRVAIRKVIEAGVAEVKARPDYETNDRLVKAAAKAEGGIEEGREALDGRRPYIRCFAAYRQAWLALTRAG